jgi:hypothetical protein
VGTFFLDFFFGGIVSCFSAETTVGANVGGSENWKESPNTRVMKASMQFTKDRETKNLRKPALASNVVNPFTRALAPPFIGRRRDFYIPRLPLNLGNIPSVNMYKNVFYIPWFARLVSYIHKPATSSHFKPGLLRWRLWLASFWPPNLLFTKITAHCGSESRLHLIPELRRFPIPGLRRFLIPGLHRF